MPIPTGGAWPPPQLAPAYAAYRARYASHADRLRRVYSGRGIGGDAPSPQQRVRSDQYAVDVFDTVSSWLWGALPSSALEGRVHVPLPEYLATTSADLFVFRAAEAHP